MKRLVAICGVIAVLSFTLVLVCCRDVDTSKADFTRDVFARLGNRTIPIDSMDPILSEMREWIQAPEPSWKLSLTTYAPDLIIHNTHYSLNLLNHTAVLNFQPDPPKPNWIQVVRACNTSEIGAFQRLRVRIKQAEQGVAPQSSTRSESHSGGGDNPQPESNSRSR
jgi:hypothetical protein